MLSVFYMDGDAQIEVNKKDKEDKENIFSRKLSILVLKHFCFFILTKDGKIVFWSSKRFF